jgi:hypothetical protein
MATSGSDPGGHDDAGPHRDDGRRARVAVAVVGCGVVLGIVVGTAFSLLFDDPIYVGIGLAAIGGGSGVVASVIRAGDLHSGAGS